MNLVGEKFESVKSTLYGFTGDSVHSERVLKLPVELRRHPCQDIQYVEFMVIDFPSSYNVINGHPTLNAIWAVILTYHLLVKFPIIEEIRVLKGDQQESRDIYEAASRPLNIHRVNIIKASKSPLETPSSESNCDWWLRAGYLPANKEPSI